MPRERARRGKYEEFLISWYKGRMVNYQTTLAKRQFKEPIWDGSRYVPYNDPEFPFLFKEKTQREQAIYRGNWPNGYRFGPHFSKAAQDELWFKVDKWFQVT